MLHHDLYLGYTSSLGLKRAYLIKFMDTDIQGHTHSIIDHVLSSPYTLFNDETHGVTCLFLQQQFRHKFSKSDCKYEYYSMKLHYPVKWIVSFQ